MNWGKEKEKHKGKKQQKRNKDEGIVGMSLCFQSDSVMGASRSVDGTADS